MEHPGAIQFFTATILNWHHVLKRDSYKEIIISSMRFLVREERVRIFNFVIMPNHIHLLWKMNATDRRENVQRDFLKFTAQQIINELRKENPEALEKLRVDAKDRKYQVWERNALSVDIYSREVLAQKMEYIHNNPAQERWNLCFEPRDYKYSSIDLYEYGKSKWDFLSAWTEEI